MATGEGNGPVNALDNAVRLAIGESFPALEDIELTDYKVRVLDEKKGTAAVTRVLIETSDGEKSWGTIGVSENIIEASWQALVDSIEYGLIHKQAAATRVRSGIEACAFPGWREVRLRRVGQRPGSRIFLGAV